MIEQHSPLARDKSGAGLVNTDITAYKTAIARKKRDKYIQSLEDRLTKLEAAMSLLDNTVKEMKK